MSIEELIIVCGSALALLILISILALMKNTEIDSMVNYIKVEGGIMVNEKLRAFVINSTDVIYPKFVFGSKPAPIYLRYTVDIKDIDKKIDKIKNGEYDYVIFEFKEVLSKPDINNGSQVIKSISIMNYWKGK